MNEAMTVTNSAAVLMPAMSVKQAVERYSALVGFVKELMREGTDFGTVPGTDKPTLLKPGAEKLTTFFGLTKRFTIIEKDEDWTGERHGGEAFFYYLYRCQLFHGDALIAESDGSANSWESKYRWRWVKEEDLPPQINKSLLKTRTSSISEFKFAIEKSETGGKYGKPAEYWQRFKDAIQNQTAKPINKPASGDRMFPAWEIETTVYRIPNDDIASQINTLQKMSQKRALIAASLLAVNASEFFTQDVEDMVIDIDFAPVTTAPATEPPSEPKQQAKPSGNASKPASEPKNVRMINSEEELANEFYKRGRAAGIAIEDLRQTASQVAGGAMTWTEAIESLPEV